MRAFQKGMDSNTSYWPGFYSSAREAYPPCFLRAVIFCHEPVDVMDVEFPSRRRKRGGSGHGVGSIRQPQPSLHDVWIKRGRGDNEAFFSRHARPRQQPLYEIKS